MQITCYVFDQLVCQFVAFTLVSAEAAPATDDDGGSNSHID